MLVEMKGYVADVSGLADDQLKDDATRALQDLYEADVEYVRFGSRLEALAARFAGIEIWFAVQDEDAEVQSLYHVSKGRVACLDDEERWNDVRGKESVLGNLYRVPPAERAFVEGRLSARIERIQDVSALRDPADIPRFIEALDGPSNAGTAGVEVRRALYRALAWHDSEEIRARLIRGFREEGPEAQETIEYVALRLPGLRDQLPER